MFLASALNFFILSYNEELKGGNFALKKEVLDYRLLKSLSLCMFAHQSFLFPWKYFLINRKHVGYVHLCYVILNVYAACQLIIYILILFLQYKNKFVDKSYSLCGLHSATCFFFEMISPNYSYSLRVEYRNYLGVGLGSLSQVVPSWLTTKQKDLCLSAQSKVGSSFPGLPLYPTLLSWRTNILQSLCIPFPNPCLDTWDE